RGGVPRRPLAAAGQAAAMLLHYSAEYGLVDTLLPEQSRQWLSAYEVVPVESRYLAMHYGHLVLVNEYDRPYVTGALLTQLGLAQSAAGWRERVAQLEAAGETEICYQPAGPDIARELEASPLSGADAHYFYPSMYGARRRVGQEAVAPTARTPQESESHGSESRRRRGRATGTMSG